MSKLPSVSYNLWSLFKAQAGKQYWFCDMKRGFKKVRNYEPKVKALLAQDNTNQLIGKLAQSGVYEFHKYPELLYQYEGVEKVSKIIELNQTSEEIQKRVISILNNYYKNPILVNKEIVQLSKGNEGYPKPITIQEGSYCFNLYAPTDCIFKDPDGTIHILDFKTGKSDFDRRQAYVYLLASSYLYPQQPLVASFYNLETCSASDVITASEERLKFLQIELSDIAKQHELEKKRYYQEISNFAEIYPPNPGVACNSCEFSYICEFSVSEV
ncbi:PD-(D/E)XK nuclease family protein [Anabaena subtropica]|uniref:PD-(D/E)XK nuclease family protein n=1 Tax=Anabaena subtropica FACHB-260 TaxID=2692884 RepID=A0ABR8CUV4_9NOST|nr:PD-(D/E)XK nuclease family protein [Anabaena subtropica]MBD2346002.1 PD-(D/E)XK nuclease family protein [Anabaena subtropica FACHB-260]